MTCINVHVERCLEPIPDCRDARGGRHCIRGTCLRGGRRPKSTTHLRLIQAPLSDLPMGHWAFLILVLMGWHRATPYTINTQAR
eukprot:scaffold155178_cov29-Tisochrysis_lutea.AAC.5